MLCYAMLCYAMLCHAQVRTMKRTRAQMGARSGR
jgi:hypothetical protein